MSNLVSTGLFILMLCVFYSRSISKDALALLSEDEKKTLADEFSGFNKFNLIPMIAGFICYILIASFHPSFSTIAFILLILFFIGFLVILSVVIIRRMTASRLPRNYIRKYRQSRLIYNTGFIFCGGTLLYELIR